MDGTAEAVLLNVQWPLVLHQPAKAAGRVVEQVLDHV